MSTASTVSLGGGGAAAGYYFGGKTGAVVGLVVGGIAGYYLDDMADAYFEVVPAPAPPTETPGGTPAVDPCSSLEAWLLANPDVTASSDLGYQVKYAKACPNVVAKSQSDPATWRSAQKAVASRLTASRAGDPYMSKRVTRTFEEEVKGYEWMGFIPAIGQVGWAILVAGVKASIKEHPTRIVWDPRWPFAADGTKDTGAAFDRARQVELYGPDLKTAASKQAFWADDGFGNAVLTYGWDKLT